MRTARVVLALCVVCGVTTPARADVIDYLGKPIGSVRLVLEGRDTTDPAMMQVVENVVGRPLTMAQVRESITHLFSLGRFEDVSVDATLAGGRVALRYDLRPIHPVTRIRFGGNLHAPGVDAGELRRAIVDRYGATPSAGRAADMLRIVEEALRERGYLHPSVTVRSETEHDPERAVLIFSVDPGVRTRIGAVEVRGDPMLPRAELIKRLGVRAGDAYQRDALAQRIDRYVSDRRRHGYYESRIIPQALLADGDRIANLTLSVTPGPHVRVVFDGDPLPAERRAELVPVEREGSIDEDLLEDSSHRIEEFLRAEGYRNATAQHTREETDRELIIRFTIKKGAYYRVAMFDIVDNIAIPRSEFEAMLRVREGQPFSDAKLDADVAAIEDLYRRRGFAAARAQANIDLPPPSPSLVLVPVNVRIVVREGIRTTVGDVTFSGNTALTGAALRAVIGLQPDTAYVPRQVSVDRDAILQAYQNLGYQSASVVPVPEFSADRSRASVRFEIQEGPRIYVDHVLIVGNVRTSTETIERELQVKRGDAFSVGAINESQRRLAALGLFRRARIAELRHGDETTRDLLVTVEEAPPTTVGYGGGVEGRLRAVGAEDKLDIAPRAFFEIGRRNLFGKNRSVNFFSSISLHSGKVPEYRLLGTYREPQLLNTAVDGFLTATVEQQIRSTFNFTRTGLSANAVRRLTSALTVTGNYQIQRTGVFDIIDRDELPAIDRTFPQFRLSAFSASLIRDTRNDSVDPSSGQYMSVSSQLAARAIGSEVGFVKSFFTAQVFRVVPHTNRVVFAGNARLGTASGFTEGVDLPASERFFAGGDTTVRGFPLDRLGVRHDPPQPGDTLTRTGVPIGGNGLVIFNAELRAPLRGGLGVVGFLDSGNVFARTSDIDLTELRSAAGGGIRYRSPFGPIRFDVGFKVRRQPGEGLTAWFVSFGQAF